MTLDDCQVHGLARYSSSAGLAWFFPSFEVLPSACVKTDIQSLSHVDGMELFPALLGLFHGFSSSWRFYPLPVEFVKGNIHKAHLNCQTMS